MGALVVASLFPNCFEKAKAGGHFLFFGLIVMTLIKCTNVALAHNSQLNPLFDGTFTLKDMKDIVVRRIRIEKKTTEAIKRIKVKSFNSFVITAISEKLERDFKIKQNCPF